jgi:SSS family solute:Na+ symporter
LHRLPAIDLAVLLIYNVGVVAFGCWFVRRSRSSEHFMAAGRSLPGWAVGLSIFGSYVSSISFLANPGKSYADNWNPFVFALSLPLAAWISVKYFVPFYRKTGEVSAYHHLEHRFGAWARTYAVVCFLLIQLTRLGTILYLLALALQPLIGWDIKTLILVIGVLVIIYPMLGGTEGVIWTGVVQSVVLIVGPLVCIGVLLNNMPEGPSQIFRIAAERHKFSLGSFGASLSQPTVWVVFAYGMVTNLQNFGIDQAYVQRYITARSDRDAGRSVWMGALLYIPIGALFFFIGTALFAFYQAQPNLLLADTKADAVFPTFIRTQLPVGLTGLVLAAICAAAMDSNLNCCATLVHCDVYERYFRRAKSERESLGVLRLSTVVFGALSVIAAIAMINIKSALDVWWKYAGIFSGGMVGLFLLGLVSRRANNTGAMVGTAIGIVVVLWMTFSPQLPSVPDWLRSPFHDLLIMVVGTLMILGVGWLVSCLTAARSAEHYLKEKIDANV